MPSKICFEFWNKNEDSVSYEKVYSEQKGERIEGNHCSNVTLTNSLQQLFDSNRSSKRIFYSFLCIIAFGSSVGDPY